MDPIENMAGKFTAAPPAWLAVLLQILTAVLSGGGCTPKQAKEQASAHPILAALAIRRAGHRLGLSSGEIQMATNELLRAEPSVSVEELESYLKAAAE